MSRFKKNLYNFSFLPPLFGIWRSTGPRMRRRPCKSYYGLLHDQKYPQGIIPEDGVIVNAGITHTSMVLPRPKFYLCMHMCNSGVIMYIPICKIRGQYATLGYSGVLCICVEICVVKQNLPIINNYSS